MIKLRIILEMIAIICVWEVLLIVIDSYFAVYFNQKEFFPVALIIGNVALIIGFFIPSLCKLKRVKTE